LDINDDAQLASLLANNYSCLHTFYRLGEFEGRVFREPSDAEEMFSLLRREKGQGAEEEVTFERAIKDFDMLIRHVDRVRPNVVEKNGVLILKSKCLIYEAFTYRGSVPDLEAYFKGMAAKFIRDPLPRIMELRAEELNGGRPFSPTVGRTAKEERTVVVKYLLIAALLGVDYYIRQHSEYDYALKLLDEIYKYAVEKLPLQHEEPRESYGVIALTLYLKGRVLPATGSFKKSRVAFRESAEAYVNRLRQKEQFRRVGKIKDEAEFKEKVSVTLRRAALVTAFGDGYLSFVNSEITRALETLTLARAALTRNAGRVHVLFVDMRYLACKRAAQSSNREEIERVVEGLRECHGKLKDLVENTRYHHRAAVELSLALYYRSKFSGEGSDASYREAQELLDGVIEKVGAGKDDESRNPHLLGDALIYKSYLLRRSHERTEEKAAHIDELNEAISVAKRACAISDSRGTAPLRSEAYAALGAAYTDLAEFHRKRPEEFLPKFADALRELQKALKETAENVRLEAACYLRLTRLCLLNENTQLLAHEYFEQWRKLEGKVEHAYLKEMAGGLEKKLGGRFHLVITGEKLEYMKEEERLRGFLNDVAMERFAATILRRSYGKPLTDKVLRNKFIQFLISHSDYESDSTVRRMIKDDGLLPRLRKILGDASPETE
jgi:tetratricopeptide (TPR) repeat protein